MKGAQCNLLVGAFYVMMRVESVVMLVLAVCCPQRKQVSVARRGMTDRRIEENGILTSAVDSSVENL